MTLYLSLIKFDRFEWAVEKATELGVERIVPVEASRSEQGLFQASAKRAERWRRIAREASEQSRRLRAPEVADAMKFREAARVAATHRLWLDEQAGAKLLSQAFSFGSEDTCALLVGPEGGWTDSERTSLGTAGWTAASLGPLVLRAETAVCAALAVAGHMWVAGSPLQSS